jgi:Tol biopolymer transport system component
MRKHSSVIFLTILVVSACQTAVTPVLETPPVTERIAETPAQTDSPVQSTATLSDTPTPIPTSTATLIPSPAISPTPIPLEDLFTTISIPVGGRACGSLTFKADATAQQIALANRNSLKTNFYSYDVRIADLPPEVSIEGLGTSESDSQCISTTPAIPPGNYTLPVVLTLYQEESNIPNSQTHKFLVEETFLIHLRVLPPVSSTTGLISFVSNQAGNSDYGLYVTNREGSELTRIAGELYTPAIYAWSPDGAQIAFATREGLFLNDARGQEKVSFSSARPNYISWSPDGQWILAPSYGENGDLFAADGSQSVKLPRRPSDGAWSPDSTRIAYIANPDDQPDLFIIDVASMQVSQLTDDDTNERNPAWSPDGKWIVYNSYTGSDESLNVISTEGNELAVLSDSILQDARAKWSPNSTKLIFPQGSSGKYQLMMVDRDGSNPVSITGEPRSAGLSNYAWSPDGQKIAYLDGCDVSLIDLNQMQPVVLQEDACYFSFSPDGQQLLSIESHQVMLVNADGAVTTILVPEGLGWQSDPLWQP